MKKTWNVVFIALALVMMCGLVSAETVIDTTTGQPLAASPAFSVSAAGLPCNSASQSCAGLWDLTHGVYLNYEPAKDYSDFVALLSAQGYPIATTTTGILGEDLSKYKILIIAMGSTWDSAYTPDEVTAIVYFVNSGGKLLILGENTDCPNNNLNPVAQAFGTTVGVSYLSPSDPTITNLAPHPAFTGVNSVFFRAGGEISAEAPSQIIAWTDPGEPAIAVANGNSVVIIGDSNLFDNTYLAVADNTRLALNLWKNYCPPPVPEFPSAFIPVTFIIGFIGMVLFVQRFRNN
ncbi:MAG: hypothetical protein JXA08_08870 [Methanomicrobiaceae archaeon]|nr:hypothetical protein [Methanomicrobiaceae archaeon]